MNLLKVRKQMLNEYSTLIPDVINIISSYDSVTKAERRYIAVNAYIKCVDKYDKIHIHIDDMLPVYEQMKQIMFEANTKESFNIPTLKYNSDETILKAGIPSYRFSTTKDKIKSYIKNHKDFYIPMILRANTYIGTKYGTGIYYHIIPTDKLAECEKEHSYKEKITRLTTTTKQIEYSMLLLIIQQNYSEFKKMVT